MVFLLVFMLITIELREWEKKMLLASYSSHTWYYNKYKCIEIQFLT
jgi:hypothetical protein